LVINHHKYILKTYYNDLLIHETILLQINTDGYIDVITYT